MDFTFLGRNQLILTTATVEGDEFSQPTRSKSIDKKINSAIETQIRMQRGCLQVSFCLHCCESINGRTTSGAGGAGTESAVCDDKTPFEV